LKDVIMAGKKADISVWGIPTCGSTRKAVKFLEGKGIAFEYRNLRETAAPKTLIRELLRAVDNPRKAFNTSGGAYKDGNWKERIDGMNKEQIVEALAAEPMLIKRPVVRSTKGLVAGYDEQALEKLL
jgi:arsenate reductase (glutaredoxin)